jgi:hypothetical protein
LHRSNGASLALAVPAQASVKGAKGAVTREAKADHYRVMSFSLSCRALTSRRYSCRFSYSDNGVDGSWAIRDGKVVRQYGPNYQVSWS